MEKTSRELSGASSDLLGARWFDPIEVAIRDRVRGFIEELVEAELDDALGRARYQRPGDAQMASGTAVTGMGDGNASCSARSAQ